MNPIPAPAHVSEEWPDADFDLPDGRSIHETITENRDNEEEDWDLEMDLEKSADAKFAGCTSELHMRITRPTHLSPDTTEEEGARTVKAGTSQSTVRPLKSPLVEDFEDDFSLPSELTQLSLAPISLNHRSSKNSLEWGDKDLTSSSQSSDAYSTLGFADGSSTSNSSASNPGTETEEDDDDDDDDVEGVVFPSDVFDSSECAHHLVTTLAMKRHSMHGDRSKSSSPDDDLEMGLVIDDDVDFSPSRLLLKNQPHIRSTSLPTQRRASVFRPPSRLQQHERGKSSNIAPSRQLHMSPSPPIVTPDNVYGSPCPSPTPSSSFLPPRDQKSPPVLNSPKTPGRLVRKTSLSSLPGGSSSTSDSPSLKSRYEESTAASRAKSYRSISRILHDWQVPPTRPSTPSTSTAALRLTMPTAGRFKSRPALASIFGGSTTTTMGPPPSPPQKRTVSSQTPPRPPSRVARPSRTLPNTLSPPPHTLPPMTPRVLRKPKRQRTYDGTELDEIDDLPTNRDQESQFRVQPKAYGNRVPGGYFPNRLADKSTVRKKSSRREHLESATFKAYIRLSGSPRKKKTASSQGKRRPMLIRNLGGTGPTKVIGDMKWNPYTFRWEGNDQALRDFDAVVTSTRPALITHLTGSSIGSPVGPSFAAGARRVGNMIFDPGRLCWISTLPPDEDEPDVFANLADDEEDCEYWPRTTRDGSLSCAASPMSTHTRASSECSDRGSRASLVYDIDEAFVHRCKLAEERHRIEMKGWKTALKQDVFSEPDRSFLHTLRDIAMSAIHR